MRVAALTVAFLASTTLSDSCSVEAQSLPQEMAAENAVRLERDVLRLRELQKQVDYYSADAREICDAYKISLEELTEGTVAVNYVSGLIVRPKPGKTR